MAEELSGGVTDYTSSGIVTKPVVLTSVARLLGTNIKDLGRLCTSDNVNMWAKYKPFSIFMNDGSYEANTGIQGNLFYNSKDEDFRKNVNYGLKLSGSSPLYYWTWNKPRLGKEDPARLGDFWGYLHDAKAPYHILVSNAGVSTANDIEASNTATVFTVKGFTDTAEDKIEFRALPNTHRDGEYYMTDIYGNSSGTYSYFILVIELSQNNYRVYNMTAPSGTADVRYCSINLPMTTAGTYRAAIVLNTSSVTNGSSPSSSSFLPYPLLAKNNLFNLKLVQHTVWDNSSITWSYIQLYLLSRRMNVSVATGNNGTNETWNIYGISAIRASCNLTFDSMYARSFYIFLKTTIGLTGSVTSNTVNNPLRIVFASDVDSTVEECLKSSSKWQPSYEIQSADNDGYYYDKSSGLTCALTKNFNLSGNTLYICIKTNEISTMNLYLTRYLNGYSTNSKNSNYDCGEGSKYEIKVDISKLNSASVRSYINF